MVNSRGQSCYSRKAKAMTTICQRLSLVQSFSLQQYCVFFFQWCVFLLPPLNVFQLSTRLVYALRTRSERLIYPAHTHPFWLYKRSSPLRPTTQSGQPTSLPILPATHPARHPTWLATPLAPVASKKKRQPLNITCIESPLQPQTGKVNDIKAIVSIMVTICILAGSNNLATTGLGTHCKKALKAQGKR